MLTVFYNEKDSTLFFGYEGSDGHTRNLKAGRKDDKILIDTYSTVHDIIIVLEHLCNVSFIRIVGEFHDDLKVWRAEPNDEEDKPIELKLDIVKGALWSED